MRCVHREGGGLPLSACIDYISGEKRIVEWKVAVNFLPQASTDLGTDGRLPSEETRDQRGGETS